VAVKRVWVRGRVGLHKFDTVRLLGHGSDRVGLDRVSGLLMSGRFRFRVVSGQAGLVIGSSSIGSFQISGRIRLGRVSYRVI
jgi:hypothetical protein